MKNEEPNRLGAKIKIPCGKYAERSQWPVRNWMDMSVGASSEGERINKIL